MFEEFDIIPTNGGYEYKLPKTWSDEEIKAFDYSLGLEPVQVDPTSGGVVNFGKLVAQIKLAEKMKAAAKAKRAREERY